MHIPLVTFLILPVTYSWIQTSNAQFNQRILTLQDAIGIAKEQSPDALNSKQSFRASFWEYRSFKASYLPSLQLDANIPQVQRAITPVTDPVTGEQLFVPQQYISSDAILSLTQKIGFSGGSIFIRSGLEAMYNITDSSVISSFLSTPVNIGLVQPIFQFNPYRWERKIHPIKYSQAKQQYLEDVEQISITTTNYFF